MLPRLLLGFLAAAAVLLGSVALEDEKVRAHTAGKTVMKVIVVPEV